MLISINTIEVEGFIVTHNAQYRLYINNCINYELYFMFRDSFIKGKTMQIKSKSLDKKFIFSELQEEIYFEEVNMKGEIMYNLGDNYLCLKKKGG